MAMVEEKGSATREHDYTQDGTVDIKGRPVLRSETGRWKACSFIVGKMKPFAVLNIAHIWIDGDIMHVFLWFLGYEVFERMAYYGIASNLVIYLTSKLHEGTVESSNNVSNWSGSVWMMPLVGAYIADAYFGRYWTFVIASCIYLLVCNDSKNKRTSYSQTGNLTHILSLFAIYYWLMHSSLTKLSFSMLLIWSKANMSFFCLITGNVFVDSSCFSIIIEATALCARSCRPKLPPGVTIAKRYFLPCTVHHCCGNRGNQAQHFNNGSRPIWRVRAKREIL